MVEMYVLGDRFKRQKKTDSIFLVKTAISEIELLSEAVCFNTLYKRYFLIDLILDKYLLL